MKRLLVGICCFLFSLPVAFAGGGITHMFIAQQTIAQLPDAKLRNLLLNNMDAYLVGAYYPDSGYIQGTGYGEDSHWDPFIFAFTDYIKEKYPNAIEQNPRLVAFLFGCAAHRESDEIIHWTFYNVSKDKDFNGDWSKAHAYSDIGIDFLLDIDKYQWITQP
ncbi:MAG: zinc dependent phospholipase C family protein, partial [Gammaproteobacteria bacterium]|nr:zinc dependent phospholipase C family protein [Gammaproteobacteria bacterium]